MADYLLTNDFEVYQPVASKANDLIASLTVDEDVEFDVLKGYTLTLRLPALMGKVTTSTTGAGSLALGKDFAEPSYWSLDQVIAVYDATAGTYLNYDPSGTTSPSAGNWSYSGGTVYFTTSAGSHDVYVYAVPFQYPVKVIANHRSPGVSMRVPLWQGTTTSFLTHNLGKSPVVFTESDTLKSGDVLEIRVTSRNQSKPFTPFLPDGTTPVKILEITIEGVLRA